MTRQAHFKVAGERLDSASQPQEGTVTIDRDCLLFTVRPCRRRRTYTLPLSTVARMVVERIIRAEIAERKREKAAKRAAAKPRGKRGRK